MADSKLLFQIVLIGDFVRLGLLMLWPDQARAVGQENNPAWHDEKFIEYAVNCKCYLTLFAFKSEKKYYSKTIKKCSKSCIFEVVCLIENNIKRPKTVAYMSIFDDRHDLGVSACALGTGGSEFYFRSRLNMSECACECAKHSRHRKNPSETIF